MGGRIKETRPEPSVAGESQRSEEVAVKRTPIPVCPVRKPLAGRVEGGSGRHWCGVE